MYEVDAGMERLAVTEDAAESSSTTTTSAAAAAAADAVAMTTFDDGVFTVTVTGPQSNPETSGTVCSEQSAPDCFVPCPRMNPLMCVQRGTLFLYGGALEDGDRQITLSDFYSLDLHRMDDWKTIIPLDTAAQVNEATLT